MDNNTPKNKYIEATYTLYDVTDGRHDLIEQTREGQPFNFISGMGITLEAFEAAVVGLETGADFDFTLTPEQAYGQHEAGRVIDLEKEMFCIDGKFDAENVRVGNILPLQNADGQRFNAVVMAIGDDKVTMDFNHPLAGKQLNFVGNITLSREATTEELAEMAKLLSGEGGCGGGCDKCGGSCGGHHDDNNAGQGGGCGHCGGCH